MATINDAKHVAQEYGCILLADYTGAANGWDLALYAPEGKAFKHSGDSVDCGLPGQGSMRSEIDWSELIAAIRESVEMGFEDHDETDAD